MGWSAPFYSYPNRAVPHEMLEPQAAGAAAAVGVASASFMCWSFDNSGVASNSWMTKLGMQFGVPSGYLT